MQHLVWSHFFLWGMSMDCIAGCCLCHLWTSWSLLSAPCFTSQGCLKTWQSPNTGMFAFNSLCFIMPFILETRCTIVCDSLWWSLLEICRLEEAISWCSQNTWDSEEFTAYTFLTWSQLHWANIRMHTVLNWLYILAKPSWKRVGGMSL